MPGGSSEFSATPIASFPFSDLNMVGAASDEFWYSYTPPADSAIGFRAVLSAGTAYNPLVTLKYGTPGSLSNYMENAIQGTDGAPLLIPTLAGVTIYLRIDQTGGGTPAGAQVTVTARTAPIGTQPPAGSILIPHDVAFEQPVGSGTFVPLPAAALSPTTGEVLAIVPGYPAGEAGAVLPTGEILSESSYDDDLQLFNAQFQPLATIVAPFALHTDPNHRITTYGDDTFLVSSRVSGNAETRLWTVSRSGAIGGQTWTLPSGHSTTALTADPTTEIAYYASTSAAGGTVRRFDIGNGVGLSDLTTGDAGFSIVRDSVIVLDDGTVAVGYKRVSPRDNYVKRYSTAGAEQNTYAIGATSPISGGTLTLDRIQRVPDDPTAYKQWVHVTLADGFSNLASLFRTVRISDGAVLDQIEPYQQEQGSGPYGVADPPDFGHSFSCPFLILQGNPIPIDASIPCCTGCGGACGCGGGDCCGSSAGADAGCAGDLTAPIEDSWAGGLAADAPNGRLIRTTSDPTPLEGWL